jgi:8-oxo-dGTP diphosphatase
VPDGGGIAGLERRDMIPVPIRVLAEVPPSAWLVRLCRMSPLDQRAGGLLRSAWLVRLCRMSSPDQSAGGFLSTLWGLLPLSSPPYAGGVMVRCVGAVVRDGAGRLLLVRRGREPSAGLWSLPGGRVERGESDAEAVVRELREETGLRVTVGALVGRVERPGPGEVTYDIYDYAARVAGGLLAPGDDATDARWVSPAELRALPTSPGLVECLTRWQVI